MQMTQNDLLKPRSSFISIASWAFIGLWWNLLIQHTSTCSVFPAVFELLSLSFDATRAFLSAGNFEITTNHRLTHKWMLSTQAIHQELLHKKRNNLNQNVWQDLELKNILLVKDSFLSSRHIQKFPYFHTKWSSAERSIFTFLPFVDV